MPVKKISPEIKRVMPSVSETVSPITSSNSEHHFGRKILWTLIGVLIAYLIIFVGTLIRNNIQAYTVIGKADKQQKVVTVEAVGEAIAKPDVAVTSLGMTTEAPTVLEAQDKNTAVMNTLVMRLKEMEINEADIKTSNYYINPVYDFSEENGQQLRGYTVNQQVEVKIRQIENANAVIALAGELGINTVSGISFTVDNTETYLEQARKDAVEQLRAKIQDISSSVGIYPIAVVSYDEYQEGLPGVYPMNSYDLSLQKAGEAPQLQPGSEEIRLRVRVVLEIE